MKRYKPVRQFIDWGKHVRDGLYSKNLDGKKCIGREDQWTILTSILNNPVVYSGGAGKHISFEISLIEQYGADVFLFDPSETGIRTIQHTQVHSRLHFNPIGLSGQDGIMQLFTPVRPEEGSFTKDYEIQAHQQSVSFPCKKISTLMRELGHQKIDILKLDIEGSEYEVLKDVLNEQLPVAQICVEFHHFFKNISKTETMDIIRRMKKAGYVLFHKRELDFSFYHPHLYRS